MKRILTELGRRPVKLRGQHFLIDERVLADIIAAAELKKTDTVIEIGPGLGILTNELLRHVGYLVAIEIDLAFVTYLRTRFNLVSMTTRLNLVEGDILELDLAHTIAIGKGAGDKSTRYSSDERYKVVANIPYNITSAVLEKFLEADPRPELMVLLVQKEVALRVTAVPPRMNQLAAFVQYFGQPEIIRRVPRSAFWPAPRVDSAILRIRRREIQAPREQFFRLVRAGFSAPRKKLATNLERELSLSREEVISKLRGAGIDPDARAETVSFEQWLRLSE